MRTILAILAAALLCGAARLPAQAPAAPATRFVGTWVGTQAWDIPDPPPGSRQDQPVTLLIEVQDGRISGSVKPFMGSEDGATFVDAQISGEELRANAIVGRQGRGRGGASPPRVEFVFRNEGLTVSGTAAVFLGDVPWTRFRYALERKRSRY